MGSGCGCYRACYGYTSCSCDYICYAETTCSCDLTCYDETGACTCEATCYNQFATKVAPFISIGGIYYYGDERQLSASWDTFVKTWAINPATGLEWTVEEINAVNLFGIEVRNAGGITSGSIGNITQEYMTYSWYPSLPVYIIRIYKNNVEVEKIFQPIIDAGTESDQTINISTILDLVPGDTVRIALVKVSAVGEQVIGEANGIYTNFAIHRIDGQCA